MIWKLVSSQFGNPRGILGKLAGQIMSERSSNNERINLAIENLDLSNGHNVLEVGYGPGIAIEKISPIVGTGTVYGIDHSDLMRQKAEARNRSAIESGRIKIRCGSIESADFGNVKFDRILDINSFQFWDRKVETLVSLRDNLTLSGKIELVYQPRHPGATAKDTENALEKYAKILENAGFKISRKIIIPMTPVPTMILLGESI